MSRMLDFSQMPGELLGRQYEEALRRTLATLWRQKQLILKTIAITLALGILASFMLPKRYTAEALVHGGYAPYAHTVGRGENGAPTVNLDASLVVETQSRLLESHQLARDVVNRLGLDQLRSELTEGVFSGWLQRFLYGDAVDSDNYKEDKAAARLQRGLSVKTEPRVYLIAVQYTAGDPELAARITNAFVVEFLRVNALQALSAQRASAQAALAEQTVTFGEKHPTVIAARARLEGANSLLNAQLSEAPDDIVRDAGENAIFAQAVAVPASPSPPLILGLAVLIGAMVGIGVAMWIARHDIGLRSLGSVVQRDAKFSQIGSAKRQGIKRQPTKRRGELPEETSGTEGAVSPAR
jgi:uncharacterized protein involved in exopolysaccharide biosynthesis